MQHKKLFYILGAPILFSLIVHNSNELAKIYFKIDQQLARLFEYYGACLSSNPPPPSFLCSEIITLFLKFNDLHQSGNRVVILANCGILIPLFQFQCRLSFNQPIQYYTHQMFILMSRLVNCFIKSISDYKSLRLLQSVKIILVHKISRFF